ncbi:MAG: diguanylate cyclase [Blautia sp.]|nr:diguanylate cyclase [Blautia sp.]
MNNDVLIAFSVFQLTFLMLDIFILVKTDRDIARKDEYMWFYTLIGTHMAYLLFNNLWTLAEYDLIEPPRTAMMFICTASLWSVENCATFFFFFVVEKLQLKQLQSGVGRWLRWLPAAFSTLLIATNPWTGLVFHFSEEGYFIHGLMYLSTLGAVTLYLLIVAVVALVNMMRKKIRSLRRTNATLFISVLLIIVFVVVDGHLKKASILPAAVFSAIVGIFITMQEANINSDALTGMNNRRKAEDYLSDKVKNVSEKKPLYLYMGDLNNFKKINDTYGHAVGDEALILCSQALKQTIGRYGGFAARYGGDEFLMSWQPDMDKKSDPETIITDVNALLEELSKETPYRLMMTIGYTCCTDAKEPLVSYIRQADSMLYQRKKAAKVGR